MPDSKLSERQVKLISFVSALPEKSIRLTILQKAVFLCMEQVKSCDMKYSYRNGLYGPFSIGLVKDLEDLQEKGIVKLGEGRKVFIISKPKEKSSNAKKTAMEFRTRFPDDSTVIASALASPLVLGRSVGEPIKIS